MSSTSQNHGNMQYMPNIDCLTSHFSTNNNQCMSKNYKAVAKRNTVHKSVVRPAQKRKRTSYTAQQLITLEKMFEKCSYIDEVERKKLSTELNVTAQHIKIWFQNRRLKWKREKRQAGKCQDGETLDTPDTISYPFGPKSVSSDLPHESPLSLNPSPQTQFHKQSPTTNNNQTCTYNSQYVGQKSETSDTPDTTSFVLESDSSDLPHESLLSGNPTLPTQFRKKVPKRTRNNFRLKNNSRLDSYNNQYVGPMRWSNGTQGQSVSYNFTLPQPAAKYDYDSFYDHSKPMPRYLIEQVHSSYMLPYASAYVPAPNDQRDSLSATFSPNYQETQEKSHSSSVPSSSYFSNCDYFQLSSSMPQYQQYQGHFYPPSVTSCDSISNISSPMSGYDENNGGNYSPSVASSGSHSNYEWNSLSEISSPVLKCNENPVNQETVTSIPCDSLPVISTDTINEILNSI